MRNTKNYAIIMNTLLRKAAEAGGVHPLYLNDVSSANALKIEAMPALGETPTLMRDIFRSYCRLVRKHSMKEYSRVVQKTIILIDSDLSADLSLKSLATNQGISPGYLSTVFKKKPFPNTFGKSASSTPHTCLPQPICRCRPLPCTAASWTCSIFQKYLKDKRVRPRRNTVNP